mmetsp:Transcript_4462/g.10746  ORF Transcript_4462/g.10746 Transcript_4462/m.10746 type:complete len:93 (+) Transcript_4462:735-1013(+)
MLDKQPYLISPGSDASLSLLDSLCCSGANVCHTGGNELTIAHASLVLLWDWQLSWIFSIGLSWKNHVQLGALGSYDRHVFIDASLGEIDYNT